LAEKTILAGGCFWCIEADLKNCPESPRWSPVSLVHTEPTYNGNHEVHYEAVEISYDPKKVSYRQLLAMAYDLAPTPSSGVFVQCCGDAHLCNFGGFATPERRIIFSINDLDGTHPAPWEWDVKPLAASFVVGCRDNA
jgi:hypothetical protein